MNLSKSNIHCQIQFLREISAGPAELPPLPLSRRVKMMIRRRLNPALERNLKRHTNRVIDSVNVLRGIPAKGNIRKKPSGGDELKVGDWVRVRSMEEIYETVNHWKQLKGCAFMPVMAKYCGTTQQVMKTMKGFVDERDLNIKKVDGIILLKNILCEGTEDYGACDRACIHFWRKEWLEKEANPIASADTERTHTRIEVRVRIKSLAQIKKILDNGNKTEQLLFVPEMEQYCGTEQRVLKNMNRYLDEHDLKVKKAKDILLLEDIICSGRSDKVSCDRSCFYMWKTDWVDYL